MSVESLTGILGPQFHTGLIVGSIDAAMADLGPALGLEWAPVVRRTGPIHTPAGLQPRDMVITYSRGIGQHIELVEYLDDTAYRHMQGGPAHHIGFWVDDLVSSMDALAALGFPSEAAGAGDGGTVSEFSYHFNRHSGIWIEIVDAAARPGIERWTRPNP
ncbi:VOC family protein [Rhodococcus sp. NPDC057529]|uniref:VOC family protein n=1 Tax=Rhodococcus sp. NPDC057529 TaxID=3346158 RepID=UPI00366D278B